jgi:hypothetical protein
MNTKVYTGKENEEETVPKKKTRVAHVYGVDQSKFSAANSAKVDKDLVEHLKTLVDLEEREEAFAGNRNAVQKLLTSSLDMLNALPGFFENQCHCQRQFEWLTNSTIVDRINQELSVQFGYLKLVLTSWITTKDFRMRAEAVRIKSAEQDGSKIPEYIFLLRELTQLWHNNRSGFIRTAQEDGTSSPHIVFIETTSGYR